MAHYFIVKKIQKVFQTHLKKKVLSEKKRLTDFLIKCSFNMEMKKWTYNFFTDVLTGIANS